jgi:pyruvate/2-oxoglutarate dehydrogenase complex dihydrolipoamide acyltransferase (E2) component
MPQLGESMAEATIVAIKIQPGEKVVADQEIIEVETDKAVMGVTTPCPGEIAKIDAEVKGVYSVGAVLGYIEASEADAARFVKQTPEQPQGEVAQEVPGRQEESAIATKTQNGSGSHFQVDETSLPQVATGSHFQVDQKGVLPVPAGAKGAGYFSPRVKARMAELQLTNADLASIQGSGNAGRVTIKDLEAFPRWARETNCRRCERDPHRSSRRDAAQLDATARDSRCFRLSRPSAGRSETARPETGPGFVRCARSASLWRESPAAASRLIGGRAFRSESIDIGVAVEAQDGIMVPVIRNADKTSLADLTSVTRAGRTRSRRRDYSRNDSGGIASCPISGRSV